MDYTYITLKLVTGFAGLWLTTRILGKKEISQLTPFDFISSLLLSELVGNTIYDKEIHFSHLLYAIAFWGLLSYALEILTFRVKRLRKPLDGSPDIIIEDGRINLKQMHHNKMDFEQLQMLLRQKDIFSIREVAYAVLETNGNLSVLKKSFYDGVTRSDLNLPEQETHIAYSLIEDGEINKEELAKIGKTKEWLLQELSSLGYSAPSSIPYAEWKQGEGLYVIKPVD
ncbi:hypothetical protein SY83_17000 [Paenibacillus swuensis]|uniref:DUF421 domain-containing protein n=1 Tax=Paenibacillus swuensis TaxID=1178515 RepID=A0A172TLK4_9BACL|nr:DUF421 domain-containing protein [Paenibacillus swuensis]ANE47697.1 hypothetical protein SY83_17000 [Paenibacillus swuensis]